MVAEFTGQHQHLPAEFGKAERSLQRLINNRLFAHGKPDHPQVLTSSVSLGVGLEENRFGNDDVTQSEVLRLTLKDPHIETIPSEVREAVLKTLSEVPGLKTHVAFGGEEAHANDMKEKLRSFKEKGADISASMLEWRGFSSQKDNIFESMPDYALRIKKSELDVTASISIPASNGEADKAISTAKQVEENINKRLPEIKALLAERTIKYKSADSDADKQKIRDAVSKMQITVIRRDPTMGPNWSSDGEVTITFQSPEQFTHKEAEKANKLPPAASPEEQKKRLAALEASNIASGLSPDLLGKAIGRAVLFAGESSKEIFPLIAGRKDMEAAIAKSLTRLKQSKPDLAAEVDAFLADDLFKSHDWSKRDTLKKHPIVNKDPAKPGEMTIDLTLPKGKAWEAVQAIAGLNIDPAQPAPAHTAPASAPTDLGAQARQWIESHFPVKVDELSVKAHNKDTEHFASVNSLQLVGVVGPDKSNNAAIAAQAQNLINQINQANWQASKPSSRAEKIADLIMSSPATEPLNPEGIKPLAEMVVLKVEEANKALESLTAPLPESVAGPIREAHKAVEAAVLMEAKSWQQRCRESQQQASLTLRP